MAMEKLNSIWQRSGRHSDARWPRIRSRSKCLRTMGYGFVRGPHRVVRKYAGRARIRIDGGETSSRIARITRRRYGGESEFFRPEAKLRLRRVRDGITRSIVPKTCLLAIRFEPGI